MQVRPVTTAPARAPLPTAAEAAANPALIATAPPRAPRGVGAFLGAGLLGSLLSQAAGCAREAGQPADDALYAYYVESENEAIGKAENPCGNLATTIAPMLSKALEEDGRGAFGCVAVDPPVFLSENEALNLIEQEFAKAGIKLRDCFMLTGFTRTLTDWSAPRETNGKTPWEASREERWYDHLGDGDPARPRKCEPGTWVFDFASEDGSLLVEFLSLADHDKLKDSCDSSTVHSYEFPRRAARFREELATRTNGAPVTVALFFDPLAARTTWDRVAKKCVPRPDSALSALSSEELFRMSDKDRDAILKRESLEKLREQVRFFLEWAKTEGVL